MLHLLYADFKALVGIMAVSLSIASLVNGIEVPKGQTKSVADLVDGNSSSMDELVVSGTLTCDRVKDHKMKVNKITIADGGQFICDLSQDPESQLMIEMSGAKEIEVLAGGALSLNGSQKLPWTRLKNWHMIGR